MASIQDMVESRAIEITGKGTGGESLPVTPTKKPVTGDEAKDLITAMATEEAIKDADLRRGVTDRRKAALLNSAEADMKREEAANKEADILLQEANYGVYSGVANYAGIKRPLPKWMQSILFAILSAYQMILLLIIGLPTSLLTITMDCIDSVVKKLKTLTKSAMWIVLVILMGGGLYLLWIIAQFLFAQFGAI